MPPGNDLVKVTRAHESDLPSLQPAETSPSVGAALETGPSEEIEPSLEAQPTQHEAPVASVGEVLTGASQVPDEVVDADAETGGPQQMDPASEEKEIDADLATTLGRPKVSKAPTGKLGALLAGRSMLVPGSVTGEGEEGDGLSDTSKLVGAYDEDAVRSAWADLIQDLRDKNKMGMAATLATGALTFEDPSLKLVVANNVQYEELKECATALLHFLRLRIGNGNIAFEVEVGEEVAAPKFLTPKDRYHHWASDNPALEELRVRLDLDLG